LDLEDLELFVAGALEPVRASLRDQDALVRAQLGDELVLARIEPGPPAQDVPHAVEVRMRMEVRLTALCDDLDDRDDGVGPSETLRLLETLHLRPLEAEHRRGRLIGHRALPSSARTKGHPRVPVPRAWAPSRPANEFSLSLSPSPEVLTAPCRRHSAWHGHLLGRRPAFRCTLRPHSIDRSGVARPVRASPGCWWAADRSEMSDQETDGRSSGCA